MNAGSKPAFQLVHKALLSLDFFDRLKGTGADRSCQTVHKAPLAKTSEGRILSITKGNGISEQKMNKSGVTQRLTAIPFEVDRQFFQIQGSKFKPDPFCDLSQASVRGISHTMLLFGIRKDTLDCFLAVCIHLLVFRYMAIVLD